MITWLSLLWSSFRITWLSLLWSLLSNVTHDCIWEIIAAWTIVTLALTFDLCMNRSEVVGVCSRAGVPDYTQRDELPLLQASVQELLRLISHVPLSLPHYTTEDTQLQNYTVPQNTQVCNYLHYPPKYLLYHRGHPTTELHYTPKYTGL